MRSNLLVNIQNVLNISMYICIIEYLEPIETIILNSFIFINKKQMQKESFFNLLVFLINGKKLGRDLKKVVLLNNKTSLLFSINFQCPIFLTTISNSITNEDNLQVANRFFPIFPRYFHLDEENLDSTIFENAAPFSKLYSTGFGYRISLSCIAYFEVRVDFLSNCRESKNFKIGLISPNKSLDIKYYIDQYGQIFYKDRFLYKSKVKRELNGVSHIGCGIIYPPLSYRPYIFFTHNDELIFKGSNIEHFMEYGYWFPFSVITVSFPFFVLK